MTRDVQPGASIRRGGAETRRQARQVALELFTTQGYEATSLRQIADVLGINKASLYYYFANKEAILQSLFEERGSEAEQLLDWLRAQPQTPDLLGAAVMRWVGSFSTAKLRGIRFMAANPLIARSLTASGGDRIGSTLTDVVDELVTLLPSPTHTNALILRMAVLSINAAVEAAVDTETSDQAIIAAANCVAHALIAHLTVTS